MKDFLQLRQNLKKDFSTFESLKIAVLGDTTTQFLTQTIKGLAYEKKLNLEIWEADFNQIERQVYDSSSELYAFGPEITVVYRSSQRLLEKYNKNGPGQCLSLASQELDALENIHFNLTNNMDTKVVYYNYTEIDDAVFGSYANQTEASFLFQLRKLNFELMTLAIEKTNMFLCDISSVQNQVGKSNIFDPHIYINTEIVLSFDALPKVATRTIDVIAAIVGRFKKCVILDLDNTIWGGVIGDDGLEHIQMGSIGIGKAFSEFQHWIKKLKNRGIIVAICSKNTESVALEPFEKHPDMVLRMEDIVVFKANWNSKVDNIREIQNILNISFDSIVFLDDNPFERNVVREHIPEICVPELPEDPANYLDYLYGLNLFETLSYSSEDVHRTRHYQTEAKRTQVYKSYTNEDDFLKSLKMCSEIQSFNTFNTARIAQLSQRSNQFNLRTIRYTQADIERISMADDFFTFAFTLEDKFGDNGLVCVSILKKEKEKSLFIDTWLMSCRVLNRGMENFVLNQLVKFAQNEGFSSLLGEYVPSGKNELVKDHYLNLGFYNEQQYFRLPVKNYQNKKNHIQVKDELLWTESAF